MYLVFFHESHVAKETLVPGPVAAQVYFSSQSSQLIEGLDDKAVPVCSLGNSKTVLISIG